MEEAINEFIKYTDTYKEYGDKIDLKIKHSMRVKDNCIEIAKSLNLSEEDIELAGLCGLLHDIGRFAQWQKYRKYDDKNTKMDHGDYGYRVLKKDNYLRKFNRNPKNDNIILKAVKYHNKYEIAKSLTKREKLFTNITRDADKLDLLYLCKVDIFTTEFQSKTLNDNVYKSLLEKKLVSKDYIESELDMVGVRLGLIYDLNFKYSYLKVKEENYMNSIVEKQIKKTNNNDLINQLTNIKNKLTDYIEEMIIC